MDSQKTLTSVPCPLHPSEAIQRVALDPDADQQLFCLECILQCEDNSHLPSDLKTIKDFIDLAANHYTRTKGNIAPTSQVPPEYTNLLAKQGQSLEKLSAHIEEEKKKVERIFDKISDDVMKYITQKRTEYLYSLDQQLFNLRYWYIFFDKQVKKAHPTEEDIPFLFPSREDLVNRMQKISNATQLMAFVRNIREDLNEKKVDDLRGGKKTSLNELYKRLEQMENEKPYYDDESLELSNFKADVNKFLAHELEKLFVLSHPIVDVQQRDFPTSKIVITSDFKMLKSWLPRDFSRFNPKLLYRATRDGMNGQAFHTHCDGKGATLSIMKIKLNSGAEYTVGGFLDQSWSQTGNAIYSSKAFLFSLTSKVKCDVSPGSEAAYGIANQGPLFGGGYDLGVSDFAGNQNYCAPCSYVGTSKLFGKKEANKGKPPKKEYCSEDEDYEDDYEDEEYDEEYGEHYFKLLELEVYTIN